MNEIRSHGGRRRAPRPPHLLAARERLVRGGLTPAEFKRVADRTVDEALELQEAAKVVSVERLALSPQCGFTTSDLGNASSMNDERAKLRTIVDPAARIWA